MIIPLWHLRLNLTALLLSFSLFVVFLVFVSGFWLFTLFFISFKFYDTWNFNSWIFRFAFSIEFLVLFFP